MSSHTVGLSECPYVEHFLIKPIGISSTGQQGVQCLLYSEQMLTKAGHSFGWDCVLPTAELLTLFLPPVLQGMMTVVPALHADSLTVHLRSLKMFLQLN